MRDAENFGLQVYNDSYGYGIIELVENMLVDFEEVKADWKKQWAVCEGVAIYMQGDTIMPMIGYASGLDPKIELVLMKTVVNVGMRSTSCVMLLLTCSFPCSLSWSERIC